MKHLIKLICGATFLVTGSLVISHQASAETLVGELVLVGGECPAGYLPVNGRVISSEEFPELASVLNKRPDQGNSFIQIGNLRPVFEVITKTTDTAAISETGEFGDLDPKYCIASGGDTPPVVDVGLKFTQGEGASGSLDFFRVDVSGLELDPKDTLLADFFEGNIDLSILAQAVPGITRPNVRFRIVNDNACRAYENFRYTGLDERGEAETVFTAEKAYPGELRLSGVQISTDVDSEKSQTKWGNDFDQQRALLVKGGDAAASSFTYTAQKDELGRYGFVAVDFIDERSLVLENRNTVGRAFQYRVQAKCGEGDRAYNVYYDPQIRHNGGGGGFPY